MKTATIKQLKTELQYKDADQLSALLLRLTKYKKENKELLTYLLFDGDDENNYIQQVKKCIDDDFSKLNINNNYLAKKTIRKVLRTANKYIKYSGNKQTEVEVLIYFLQSLKEKYLDYYYSRVIENMYYTQLNKVNKSLLKLHEDIQYDYKDDIEKLEED